MKLKHLLFAAFAAVATLASCEKEEDLGAARIVVTPGELKIETSAVKTETVELTATRKWTATAPDWIGLSAYEGEASASAQKISVTVKENTGNDRKGEVVFTIGLAKATLVVSQKGEAGELKAGTGTKDDPFSVAGAIAYVEELGADVKSDDEVYVKGKISAIEEAYSSQYGNATFFITDDGSAESPKFYVFRVKFLGNAKWATGNTQVAVGDEVVVCSRVVNYKGNTPETVMISASAEGGPYSGYLYSLNGKTEDQKQDVDYSKAEAKTVADFIAAADKTTYYKLTGTVGGSINTQYGNFDLTDATGTIYVYGTTNISSYASKLVDGATVTLAAVYDYYEKSSKHEAVNAYILSCEGGTPPTEDTPSGEGTLASPYNPKAAYDAAAALESGGKTGDVYVAGKISSIKYTFSAQYGTATFNISEDGTSKGTQFPCYSVFYLGNKAWEEGDAQVVVGDEVVIFGKLVNYNGNTPETSSKEAYIYSLNGQTSIEQGIVFGVASTTVNVGASATSAVVKVTGNVAWTASCADATIDKTSGEGSADITVSFAANTDTENAKTYKVVLTTTADVATKEITVTVTQGKANAAGTVEVTYTKDQLAAAAAGGATVKVDEVISFTNSSSYSGSVTELRVYKNQTLTLSAVSGYKIVGIQFTCTASGDAQYGPGCFEATAGSYTASDKLGIWEGEETSVAFKAVTNQVRIVEMKVAYIAQ